MAPGGGRDFNCSWERCGKVSDLKTRTSSWIGKYAEKPDTILHSHSIENQISVAIIGYIQMNAPIIALCKIATRVSFSEVH